MTGVGRPFGSIPLFSERMYDMIYLYLHSYNSLYPILFVVKVISWRSFVGELLAPTAPPPCFHGAPVAMSRSPPFFILLCLLMISRSGTNKSTLAEPPDTPQHSSTQPARERAGTFSTRLLVATSLVYICCCRCCVVASSPRSVLWRVCFRGCLKKQPAKYK